jgi:hypothetical protein
MSKISELSDGGVVQGGDTLIAVRSGGNVKVTYGGSTTANIDGGTIDGTVIGGTTPAAGSFTTLELDGTGVTATATELNVLDGITATTAELNILDGITATTAELNLLDGVTATGTGALVFGTSPTLDGTVVDNTTNLVTNANIGTEPNELLLNATLGALAYQDVLGLYATTNVTPTIASAATIQPTAPITFISGTTNVVDITSPEAFVGGGQITLIPTGLWSTTTAGNIALATTAVVDKALIMTYDAATDKFYPSY